MSPGSHAQQPDFRKVRKTICKQHKDVPGQDFCWFLFLPQLRTTYSPACGPQARGEDRVTGMKKEVKETEFLGCLGLPWILAW